MKRRCLRRGWERGAGVIMVGLILLVARLAVHRDRLDRKFLATTRALFVSDMLK